MAGLVEDIQVVRKKGIRKPNLIKSLPTLARAMERYWPLRAVEDRGHFLEEFLEKAAEQLGTHDNEGIRLALGIGALDPGTSAKRRADFASHYDREPETVRRPGHLEEQAFKKLAKAVLGLIQDAELSHIGAAATVPTIGSSPIPDPEDRPDPIITSRERASFAIGNFVQDLRLQIEQLLLTNFPAEEVLREEYERLSLRQGDSEVPPMSSLSSYLLPQEAYEVLLRYADDLPSDLNGFLNLNVSALESTVPVFNRITRNRPLHPGDLEATEEFIERFRTQRFPKTAHAVAQLGSDPGWQPRHDSVSIAFERILHNLPSPEFDETGLLGREQEIQKVIGLLKRQREPITLLGEGGIGKTALALEACYRLADDPEPPFEVILWTSLKSEQLTPAGIKELSRTVKDIDGIVGALGKAIDTSHETDVAGIISALGGRKTLIVIDNLESNLGNDVVELYDSLPPTVTLLFTSRRGLGQIDRPFPIEPLEPESAAHLFRTFARSRGLFHLAELSTEALDQKLNQLRFSPLAIRWFVLSVETGKAPSDALRDQRELLRFCVGNVVEDLGEEQRLLLSVFRAFDRPVSFDELAVISDIDPDTLRRGVQNLRQASLVVLTRLPGDEDSDALQLSSSAREFLPLMIDSQVTEEIIQREADYRKEREKDLNLLAERGRYFDPNVIFQRSLRDAPIALLLRRALREMKAENSTNAFEALSRARSINSRYFEVDRVEAFFASKRNESTRATALYRSALNNCEADEERHWVCYFYAAHLARVPGGLAEAVTLAEQTHSFFQRYDTAHALGRYFYLTSRFDEAEALIRWSLERAPTADFKLNATTSLVECFRHWSEDDLRNRRTETAFEYAAKGLQLGLDLHETGVTDDGFMHAVVRAAVVALKALRERQTTVGQAHFAEVLSRLEADVRFRELPVWRDIEHSLASLPEQLRSRVAPHFIAPISLMKEFPGERLRGMVRTVGGSFGFIAHTDYPRNIYFRSGSIRPPTWMEDLTVGSIVEFTPHQTVDGKDQALNVVLIADEGY
jgi:tetratricopeptide (TPR) repeat protein